jgi:hypothetical protein
VGLKKSIPQEIFRHYFFQSLSFHKYTQDISIPQQKYRFLEVFINMNLQETIRKVLKEYLTESELTEKCWAGYTQKGMKTMFGKKYPNCVKKTK